MQKCKSSHLVACLEYHFAQNVMWVRTNRLSDSAWLGFSACAWVLWWSQPGEDHNLSLKKVSAAISERGHNYNHLSRGCWRYHMITYLGLSFIDFYRTELFAHSAGNNSSWRQAREHFTDRAGRNQAWWALILSLLTDAADFGVSKEVSGSGLANTLIGCGEGV